jgi:hypothetical protein
LLAANMAAIPLAVSLSDEAAWYFEDIKQRGTIAALAWCVTMLCSYRQLPLKCLSALTACYFTADVATWPVWMWWPAVYDITPWFTTITAASLAVWYYRRSYRWPSDQVCTGWVYVVRRKPRSPQDLLLAMTGRQPLGGVSVMVDGQVWGFHHGILTCRSGIPDGSKYVIMRTKRADEATLSALKALEGSRWSLIHNCMTALLPVAVVK